MSGAPGELVEVTGLTAGAASLRAPRPAQRAQAHHAGHRIYSYRHGAHLYRVCASKSLGMPLTDADIVALMEQANRSIAQPLRAATYETLILAG